MTTTEEKKGPREVKVKSYTRDLKTHPYSFQCKMCGTLTTMNIWPGREPTVCDKLECKKAEQRAKVAAKRKKDTEAPIQIAEMIKHGEYRKDGSISLTNGSVVNEEYIHLKWHVTYETARSYLMKAKEIVNETKLDR